MEIFSQFSGYFLIISVFFVIRFHKRDWGEYKLRLPRKTRDRSFLLLFVIPVTQILCGQVQPISPAVFIQTVLAALCEEILFRSFLPGFLQTSFRFSHHCCAMISSAFFGLFHAANLWNGEGLVTTGILVFYAFCIGYGYSGNACLQKSILPCTVLHIVSNLTADNQGNHPIWVLCFLIVYLLYGYNVFIHKENLI